MWDSFSIVLSFMPEAVLVANLTTLSLIQNVQMTFYTLAVGFMVYTRTVINSFIGKNNPTKSREIFFKFYKVNCGISVIVSVFVYFGLSMISSLGIFESQEVKLLF
jgi:Na+-driven multidrug efflux pump